MFRSIFFSDAGFHPVLHFAVFTGNCFPKRRNAILKPLTKKAASRIISGRGSVSFSPGRRNSF